MKKVSLLILVFTLITLVLALTSCGAEAEAPAPGTPGGEGAPLLDTVLEMIQSGDISGAFNIIMDAFTTSAGIVGGAFAVIFFLIFLALYFLGLWIFII
jgi:hypothetical protein